MINFSSLVPKLGANGAGVSDIILFNMLVFQLNAPFESAGLAITTFAQSNASLAPLEKMLNFQQISNKGRLINTSSVHPDIVAQNIFLQQPNGHKILEGSNLTASPGALTAIVGPSGVGKSSFIKILAQLIAPTGGNVFVGGHNLSDVPLEDLHKLIGFVAQEVVLFSGTVAENILMGRVLDIDQLRKTCSRAGILDRIERLEDGFNTQIGEKGMLLSGGERQRLGIARALYGEPKILFLDEASSALDMNTEAGIISELRKLSQEITVVMVTHRTQCLSGEDIIWQMASGGNLHLLKQEKSLAI